MTHLTECPACRHELQVPPELLGQLVKCPMCAKTFTAPATFVDASSQSLTPPPAPPPPPPQPAYAETIETATPPTPRPRSGTGYRCPYCESTARPITRNQISVAGWIVFAVMLMFCFPLFFIGLLMTEDVKVCADCGRKLNETII